MFKVGAIRKLAETLLSKHTGVATSRYMAKSPRMRLPSKQPPISPLKIPKKALKAPTQPPRKPPKEVRGLVDDTYGA